jgi:hypothetical protein
MSILVRHQHPLIGLDMDPTDHCHLIHGHHILDKGRLKALLGLAPPPDSPVPLVHVTHLLYRVSVTFFVI